MGRRKDEIDLLKDPQAFITQFNFERDAHADERSRVDSYEEQVMLNRLAVLEETFGIPIYGTIRRAWCRYKIAKDGERAEQAVRSLMATNELQKGHYSGLEVVSAAIEDQRAKK